MLLCFAEYLGMMFFHMGYTKFTQTSEACKGHRWRFFTSYLGLLEDTPCLKLQLFYVLPIFADKIKS